MTTDHTPTINGVEVYWRPGCPFCLALRPRLHRSGLPVHNNNIWDDTQAAARLRRATGGDETVPTVFVGDTALINPGMREVRAAVREHAPHLLEGRNTAMSTIASPQQTMVTRTGSGALAGLGGGIVFGMMMAMMGMLATISGLVGSDSALVGGVLHLTLSAIFGAVFGMVVGSGRVWPLLGSGAVYGIALWIIGGLVLLPAGLGTPLLQMGVPTMQKLMGHLVFGLVTALCLYGLRRTSAP